MGIRLRQLERGNLSQEELNQIALGQYDTLRIDSDVAKNTYYGYYKIIHIFENGTQFTTLTEVSGLGNGIAFTGGGGSGKTLNVGDYIKGAAGAIAQVEVITLTSGTWAGGDAAGQIGFSTLNTTGFAASEQVDIIANYPNETVTTSDIFTTESLVNGGTNSSQALTGVNFSGGDRLYGLFTAVKLNTGAVGLVRAF